MTLTGPIIISPTVLIQVVSRMFCTLYEVGFRLRHGLPFLPPGGGIRRSGVSRPCELLCPSGSAFASRRWITYGVFRTFRRCGSQTSRRGRARIFTARRSRRTGRSWRNQPRRRRRPPPRPRGWRGKSARLEPESRRRKTQWPNHTAVTGCQRGARGGILAPCGCDASWRRFG